MSTNGRLPSSKAAVVIEALYDDAERLGWALMSHAQRSEQYDSWVSDPRIGGVLSDYFSAETARSWIKDGPMKEFARARQGAGRYAKYGAKTGLTAEQIVSHSIGSNASVVKGSVRVKPFQCLVETSAGQTVLPSFVTWGEPKNFRYLVWACLTRLAEGSIADATVVVTDTLVTPATAEEKARQSAIAKRCGIELAYYRAPMAAPFKTAGSA